MWPRRVFLCILLVSLLKLTFEKEKENDDKKINYSQLAYSIFERLLDQLTRVLHRPYVDFLHFMGGMSSYSSTFREEQEDEGKRSFFYSEVCEREIKEKFPEEGESEIHIPIPIPLWFIFVSSPPEVAIIPHDFSMMSLSLHDFYAKSAILNSDFSYLESFYDMKFERNKPFRISFGGIHSDSIIYFKILTPFSSSQVILKACIYDLKLNINLHLDSSPFSSKWLLDDIDVSAETLSYKIEADNFIEQYFLDFITTLYLKEIHQNLLLYLNRKISRLLYMNLFRISCVCSLQELLRRIKLLFTFLLKEYIPRRLFKTK